MEKRKMFNRNYNKTETMASVWNGIIWILLTSSLQLLSYRGVSCSNCLQASTECGVQYEDQLVFAHVIFRHGERNIEKSYPNDPYSDESTYWPEGFGALTNSGKQQSYELGKYLRTKYHKIIGQSYSPKKVFIQSTDFDRTLMSAQTVAAALFPPTGQEIWHTNLMWQPVACHTRQINQELLLPWNIPCPRFKFLIENYRQSSEYKWIVEQYRDLIRHWEYNCGQKLLKLVDIMFLYDTLFVEKQKGLILAEWADTALNGTTMEYLAAFHLTSFTNSTELKKLHAGFLIKEMLIRFKKKSSSSLDPNRSLWIYAAHDLTIVNILNALNLFDLKIPKYASSLHFELYQHEQEYYIQLFYRKNNEAIPLPLNIPNCGTKCTLNAFYQAFEHILPTDSEDYDSACKLSQ